MTDRALDWVIFGICVFGTAWFAGFAILAVLAGWPELAVGHATLSGLGAFAASRSRP